MVQIPIAGNVPGPVVAVAVVGGVGALGYAWWRNKKKQEAAATATAATNISGTDTTDSSMTGDQSSGYDYGAYTYDGYADGGYGNPYGNSSGYNAGLPAPPVAPASETNAQWSQAVVTALTANGAYDEQAVFAALGVYLTGGELTADQEGIVRAAIGVDGFPPVEGTGGFPPGMHTNAPSGQPAPSPKVSVPAVTGKNFGQAYNALTRAGLISVPGKNGTHAAWTVTAQSPRAGVKVNKGTVVTLTVPDPGKKG